VSSAAQAVTLFVQRTGACGLFFWDCLVSTVRHGVRWDRVMEETWKVGFRSLPVLATMAIFVGTNLAIQGAAAFSALGAKSLLGMFVALAGVREVCPLLAGTMVAAKAGTEMTAQLAVMRTKEQIDAIEVMGIDPRAELVTPPLLAIMIALPALTIVSIAIALVSAVLVSVFQLGLDYGEFMDWMLSNITVFDLVAATIKSLFFAAVVAIVSGYFGFFSERGPAGVGRATNRAVVVMCIVSITLNFFLTTVLYG
jgi:phospholipid/cholesterol/gamma-HCH transport system permease protein